MRRILLESLETCNPSTTLISMPSTRCRGRTGLKPETVVMLSLTEKLLLTKPLVAKGIRVFWIEHDRVGRWLTHNPWLPKLRRLSKLVTTVVVSELSRKIYLDLGWDPKTIVAIPNGIDIARLREKNAAPTPYPLSPTTFHIGTIARLSKDKGVDLLIDAVHAVPNIHLTIIGTGPDEGTLLQRITNYDSQITNHKSQITIKPWVDNLGNFYTSLNCFVLPSREHDPFGLVAAEAMLMGIPTVVTDACGIASYLRNGHDALIVPGGDADALSKAIAHIQMDQNFAKALGEAGKKISEQKFSLSHMVERYEKVLTMPIDYET